MKKNLLYIFTLLLISCLSLKTIAANDPVSMLQSVANQMLNGLKQNRATLQGNPRVVYSLAQRILVPHADVAEMAKRVLPPRTWNSATPAQRAQFEREFSTLLIRTYGSALAQYTDQQVKFFPMRASGSSSVRVDSQIVRDNGPAISVTYQVIRRGGQWKVYDMTVEGVSILESFRSQFADQLSQGNIADLLRVIRKHNAGND